MRSHVNLLGLLQLTWGGFALLLSLSLLFLAAAAGAIARAPAADSMAAGATAILFVIFATALAIGGCANAWTGRLLRKHRTPGRTMALALAIVNLFVLPFGTALAIYTFWVLLHNDARILFEHGTAAH